MGLSGPTFAFPSKTAPSRMNNLFFLGSVLLFAAGCQSSQPTETATAGLPYYDEATFTPHWDRVNNTSFHTIPPFRLTNQYGETITEQSLDGKISIVDFFFTTCTGICPDMSKNMAVLQTAYALDNDVLLLSHSVTPDEDSVSVLRAYAEYYGAMAGKWHLLTGDVHTIYNLGRQAYFVEENLGLQKEADDFLHTENFVLIDQNRHIRGIYNGLKKSELQQIMADVKSLQAEARKPS